MIVNQDDPAVGRLIALAEEFEASVRVAETGDAETGAADTKAVQRAVEKEAAIDASPEIPIAALKPPGPEN